MTALKDPRPVGTDPDSCESLDHPGSAWLTLNDMEPINLKDRPSDLEHVNSFPDLPLRRDRVYSVTRLSGRSKVTGN